ncbi:phage holin family protein [Oscillibacter sp. MSJ-2]|uniref:Phage holin family protein n=1 Tax=Dysosmobacter acutus TaxID=2841504 RepID=A0ABS6FBP0_9FIRM|nr:phage holin family protein [Dysosmobacter acutus]MBU5627692.1 phage holin family protein [Dysosmobacter acutus]
MDITSLGITGVAVITVICYLIGQAVKVTGLDNKYIPVIVGTTGGILGVAGMFLMPDFPANDYMTAVAVGIVSGLAATGINQVVKQMGGGGSE